MMWSEFYNEYRRVRDKAWEIIFKYEISALPVDLNWLCRAMGIYLTTYSQGKRTMRAHSLTGYAAENHGFCTIIKNNYVIFYDDSVANVGRQLFTIAHEIGHIVLGHLRTNNVACRNGVTLWNRDGKEPNDMERAANIFASRLLAPACVLKELDVHTADEIMRLCGLSHQAAEYRAKRMEELYRRNKWETSPLETRALKQFEGFIEYVKHAKTRKDAKWY